MAEIDDRLRDWLDSPASAKTGACYVLTPESAADILGKIEEARSHAAELVAANWRTIDEKDAELRALRNELKRLRREAATDVTDEEPVVWSARVPPRPVPAEEEAAIRQRLASAASSRVAEYPAEQLRQLLDDARALRRLLGWERERRQLLQKVNELLVDEEARRSSFVLHAEAQGWISKHERDVLLGLRDDQATLCRLTSG